ncbi:hypothetical protein IJT93_04770 [bacterium]|nr:hypothetical protein [bacterium]
MENSERKEDCQRAAAAIFYQMIGDRIKEVISASFYGEGLDQEIEPGKYRLYSTVLKTFCRDLYMTAECDFDKFSDFLAEALLKDKWPKEEFDRYVNEFAQQVCYHEMRAKLKKRRSEEIDNLILRDNYAGR